MNQVLQEENANSSTIYPLDHEDAGLQIGVLMLRGENNETIFWFVFVVFIVLYNELGRVVITIWGGWLLVSTGLSRCYGWA